MYCGKHRCAGLRSAKPSFDLVKRARLNCCHEALEGSSSTSSAPLGTTYMLGNANGVTCVTGQTSKPHRPTSGLEPLQIAFLNMLAEPSFTDRKPYANGEDDLMHRATQPRTKADR
jgi:hypothetical protein